MDLKEAISKQARPYEVFENTKKVFLAVRDSLEPNTPEFRLCHSKPLKFYFYHSIEEAIEILRKEVAERRMNNDKQRSY